MSQTSQTRQTTRMRRFRVLRTLGGVVTAAALLTGSPVGNAAAASSRPSSPLAGLLLSSRPLTDAAALPGAASNRLITYLSDDEHGLPVVVSGTVAIPATPAPAGGYPVISWSHGTTGVADICAPSADTVNGPEHEYLGVVDQTLNAWVQRGFVVVQSDYEGLGTFGPHPYLNGATEANAVVDIVRATRQLNPSIGRQWFVMGHSQGGQGTLFTAAQAARRAPELTLKGAVAIAPASGQSVLPGYFRAGVPGIEAAEPFIPLLVLGAQAADPAVNARRLLSDAAQPLLAAARTGCIGDIFEVPTVPATQVFRAGADLKPLTDYLAAQDPSTLTITVPTLIAQGTADVIIPKPATDALVKTLCGKGMALDYRVYPGVDHFGGLAASLQDAEDFVTAVMAGQTIPDTCD